jgi:hypothetical protein
MPMSQEPQAAPWAGAAHEHCWHFADPGAGGDSGAS